MGSCGHSLQKTTFPIGLTTNGWTNATLTASAFWHEFAKWPCTTLGGIRRGAD
jgi:hypothetical protein